MINSNRKTTTVFFAQEKEKGTISVQAFHNQLILQELRSDKEVSQPLNPADIKDMPKVICDFQRVESDDVMISILQRIKKNMQTDPYNFALAC